MTFIKLVEIADLFPVGPIRNLFLMITIVIILLAVKALKEVIES